MRREQQRHDMHCRKHQGWSSESVAEHGEFRLGRGERLSEAREMSLGHIRQGLSESQKRFGQCGVVFRRAGSGSWDCI